jgi:phospholipase/carboxylesterase
MSRFGGLQPLYGQSRVHVQGPARDLAMGDERRSRATEANPHETDAPFFRALTDLGKTLLHVLDGFELVQRRLHPPELPRLRAALESPTRRLVEARDAFRQVAVPDELGGLQVELLGAAEHACRAGALFTEASAEGDSIGRVLGAMQSHCRSQEALFPLRAALPPVNRYFVERAYREDPSVLDPSPPDGVSVGLHRGSAQTDGRGGFSLYVPESYDGTAEWPLVVALHGGSGDGRDFVWTWLREARGRRFLLLAPTSRGPTWSFIGPDVDGPALRAMVNFVSERWRVDASRVLLTGLSDGATYSLLCGLSEGSPFTAIAPLSGVLHPMNFANGNLERAAGRRVHLVHGALDWMFPVAIARVARDELEKAGADVTFCEIPDLSHTYAREENDHILSWFDPSLALPQSPGE